MTDMDPDFPHIVGKKKGNCVEVFLIFALLGALYLSCCELYIFKLLAERFNNPRFVTINIEPYVSNTIAFSKYYLYNLVLAGIVALLPAAYQKTVGNLCFAPMLSFSIAALMIAALVMSIYLNLARVNLPIQHIVFYIIAPPVLCVFVPLWLSYMSLRLLWILRKVSV